MRQRHRIWEGPAIWTLALGLVLGGIGTASVGGVPKFSPIAQASYPAPKAVVDAEPSSAPVSLRSLDEQYATLAERVGPAVVTIRVEGAGNPAMGEPSGGEGSGVIFRPDGYIVTNDHVVGGMDKVTVTLKDGREFAGKVIRAQEMDIAVVKIDAKDLPSLPFADSTRVRPGQAAMAIGAPFGLANSVTIGHISATKRLNEIPDPRTGRTRIYWDVIQTDAPINMGNSGGPLVNIEGEVIGINSAIQSTTGAGSGIGFAISANQARMLAETLIEKGKVVRSFMGVLPQDLKEYKRKEMNLNGGAYLERVTSDAPGAIAGLKTGDVVVKVGDMDIRGQVDLRNAMLRYTPGQEVDVVYLRDGKQQTAKVKLAALPEEPAMSPSGPGLRQRLEESPWGRRFGLTPPESAPEKDVPPVGGVRLGVQIENATEESRKQFSLPSSVEGAVVVAVDPESPASKAGIQPGDLIQKIGGDKVSDSRSLREAVSKRKAGDRTEVEFLRGQGQRRTVQVQF